MRYSLAKIAEELGISKTTVSFVLNGKAEEKRVSRKMQEKILAFCKRVNYSVNIHARRMNRKKSGIIDILLYPGELRRQATPLSHENTANIVGGIMNAAREQNYRFFIDIVTPDTSFDLIRNWFESREIDGLIYYGFIMPEDWRKKIIKEKFNIVGIGEDPDCGFPTVNLDNYRASFSLTQTLLNKGITRFRYLKGTGISYTGNERYRGFKEALNQVGINYEDNERDVANFSGELAELWTKNVFLNQEFFEEVVVCENDDMAIGVISELKRNNISIPETVAVTGADNINISSYVSPALTTYSLRPMDLGVKAFEQLYDFINGEKAETHVTLDTKLIIRDSCGL